MKVEFTHVSNDNIACRKVGKMCSNKNKLCSFQLKITIDESTKTWRLMCDSIIENNDHSILCPDTRLAGESDLTQDKLEFIQQLYSHGDILSTKSDIMRKQLEKNSIPQQYPILRKNQREQLMRLVVFIQKGHLHKKLLKD